MYKKENYWDSHTTMGGKKGMYSEGSVADRGGDYETPGYVYESMASVVKNQSGYGFGKKKKSAKRLGGGYKKKSGGSHNPGHNPGGY